MTIGVGVEGPSDFQFWHKVLHKHFQGCRFDVRMMKNREKLIRETPKLLETFRDCHYRAGFILVDLDDDPCLKSVFELFDETARAAARLPDKQSRFLHVCIAVKELESWFLADAEAVKSVIPGSSWDPPDDTRVLGKGRLRSLFKTNLGRQMSFNEINFAKTIAPVFKPARACSHSASFAYFWSLVASKMKSR